MQNIPFSDMENKINYNTTKQERDLETEDSLSLSLGAHLLSSKAPNPSNGK
jgi:hypothetical protein